MTLARVPFQADKWGAAPLLGAEQSCPGERDGAAGATPLGSSGGAVADAVIDNSILNGPCDPPTRHWRFDDSGITDEVVEGRRCRGYFVPLPQARQQSAELSLETEWTLDRLDPSSEPLVPLSADAAA